MTDSLSTAHFGYWRTPPVGVDPPAKDVQFRAHMGFVSLSPLIEKLDEDFYIVTTHDQAFDIAAASDEDFYIVLVDDETVEL